MTSNGLGRVRMLAVAALPLAVLVACSTVPEVTPSCIDTGCGAHAKCSIALDPPACVCEEGYTGAACADCAPGFQDENGNGFCAPSCASKTCGSHERCTGASGAPVCACVAAYSPIESGSCTFTGGPVDPSFDAPHADGWETKGAVTIQLGRVSGLPGGIGWARFSGPGEVFQTFEMPDYADAEPLAVALEVRCAAGGCANVGGQQFLRFGDRVTQLPLTGVVRLQRCLGEAAFGRVLTFGIGVDGVEQVTPLPPEGDMFVGSARFVRAPTCPAPGTVRDGDFERGDWVVRSTSGTAQFVRVETRAARLQSVCAGAAEIATWISIPETPSFALAFSIQGTPERETRVSFDNGVAFAPIRGTGKKERVVRCIPPRLHGFAYELRVAALPLLTDCESSEHNTVVVDDFALVPEPACADLPVEP